MPTTYIPREATDAFGRAYVGGEPDIQARLLRAYQQTHEGGYAAPALPDNFTRHTLHNETARTPSALLP